MRKFIMMRFLLAGSLLSVLTACGAGAGTGADDVPGGAVTAAVAGQPVLTVTAVTVSGSTDTAAAVTVAGRADEDGIVDTAFRVALPLDGVALPVHQPDLPYDRSLTITATDGASRTISRTYTLAIDP